MARDKLRPAERAPPIHARNLTVWGDLVLDRARVFSERAQAIYAERLRVGVGSAWPESALAARSNWPAIPRSTAGAT